MTDSNCGYVNYDKAWQRGPGIEEWLATGQVDVSDLQVLIAIDCIYQIRLVGKAPSRDKFKARFPDHGEVVDAAFEDIKADLQNASTKFGNYHVVPDEQLRKGGMGVVWPVKHNGVGKKLAAKVVRAGADSNSISNEIKNLRKLGSTLQHVVPLIDYGEDRHGSYYIMPWFEADSLHSWCGKRDVTVILKMLLPVIRDLDTIHTQGILHQDIKPRNLLFDEDTSRVLLSDFGLSARTYLLCNGKVSGTEHYIAPELYEGEVASVRSEVYAMGATLFHLLSGQHPFGDLTGDDLRLCVLEKSPPQLRNIRRDIDRNLSAIIGKCLEPVPSQRYAGMLELADDLQHFLNDEPVSARAPSRFERLRRWTKRNRAASRFFTVTVTLLLAIIVWDYMTFERERRIYQARFVEATERYEEMTSKATKMQQEATKYQQQYILALAEEKKTHEQRNLLLTDRAEGYRLARQQLISLQEAAVDWTTSLKEKARLYETLSSDFVAVIDIGLQIVEGLLQLKDQRKGPLQDPNERAALDQIKNRLKQLRDNQTELLKENSEIEATVDALNAGLKDGIKQLEVP